MHDVYIMTWAQAMDVHMTSVNSYGTDRSKQGEGSNQKVYGKESHYQQGDYILASGAEDPREPASTNEGHVTQLNIQEFVRDVRSITCMTMYSMGSTRRAAWSVTTT